MRLLLDTHVFIWMDTDSTKLSVPATQAIQDTQNVLYLSLTSIWEIQIKSQLGKLSLNASIEATIASQQQTNNIQILPIELHHILALENFPLHHNDPFDRLLIAQVQAESLTLVTNDSKIGLYDVNQLW